MTFFTNVPASDDAAFWGKVQKLVGDDFPKAVIQTCEVVLIGGALNVVHRFTQSTIVGMLYYILLTAFAARVVARVGMPTGKRNFTKTSAFLGVVLTLAITFAEDRAIRSAATATLIQMQSEKALSILRAQRETEKEQGKLLERAFTECSKKEIDEAACERMFNRMDSLNSDLANMMSPY